MIPPTTPVRGVLLNLRLESLCSKKNASATRMGISIRRLVDEGTGMGVTTVGEAGKDSGMAFSKDWALRSVARAGNAECVKTLLERGAPLDIGTSVDGTTALMAACEQGHVGCVTALLERGASSDVAMRGNSDVGL